MHEHVPFDVCGYKFCDACLEISSHDWEIVQIKIIQPPGKKAPYGSLRVIRQEPLKQGDISLIVAFETYI